MLSGFTVRSVTLSLLCIIFSSAMIQILGVTTGAIDRIGSYPIAIPAVTMLIMLSMVSALMFYFKRIKLVTRAEMMCIFVATLFAAPIAGNGFWRFALPTMATVPITGDFEKMDAMPDKIWPHGPNLTASVLDPGNDENIEKKGSVSWESVVMADGKANKVITLSNEENEGHASIRFAVPLFENEKANLILGQLYVFSILSRGDNISASSNYYCRTYYDDSDQFADELFTSQKNAEITFLHKEGFSRDGSANLLFPAKINQHVIFELGLNGPGKVQFRDPRLMNISALDDAYKGREVVSEKQLEQYPPGARAGLLVKPDNMFSWAGFKFLISGYIPWQYWIVPTITWLLFILIVLTGTLAVAVIMRKQWVDNERYRMPLIQIPLLLLGTEADDKKSLPAIWNKPIMWVGFGFALVWCILKGAYSYNPELPDMSVYIPLKSYFSDASFGRMFQDVEFRLYALILGIAVFMELNVLLSLVVGFFLFRVQFWFGEAHGLMVGDFPYEKEQQLGGYLIYALIVLIFSRKYLRKVIVEAFKGTASESEIFSYRTAFFLLIGSFVLMSGWAWWTGLPVVGMVIFLMLLLSLSFTAAKLRAECGIPSHQAFPAEIMVIAPLLGGMSVMGVEGVFFLSFFAIITAAYCFFFLPGLQLEFLELGRRFKVKGSHIIAMGALGIVAGMMIGGWFYLGSANAMGADDYPYQYDFGARKSNFSAYNSELGSLSDEYKQSLLPADTRESAKDKRFYPNNWGYIYSGGMTAGVAIMRQVFAGFWFHPIGIILGATPLLREVWGSLLFALIIRFAVLKVGGAVTVRDKLLPFFTGVFLASIATTLIYLVVDLLAWMINPDILHKHGIF